MHWNCSVTFGFSKLTSFCKLMSVQNLHSRRRKRLPGFMIALLQTDGSELNYILNPFIKKKKKSIHIFKYGNNMQRKNTAVTFIKLLDLNMNLCTSDMHVSTSMSSREMKGELVGA